MYVWIRRLIYALALLGALFLPVCSFADGISYSSSQDALTITCTKGVAGEEYSLLLVRQGAGVSGLSAEDVYFIDQLTAGDSGRIEALLVCPDLNDFTVIMGGSFAGGASSPRVIGSFSFTDERHALNLPAMLFEIQESAFENGTFTHVYLGENVQSIGARAFAGCTNLAYIYIPDTTQTIAEDAFSGCSALTIGCHDDSTAQIYAQSHAISYRIVD